MKHQTHELLRALLGAAALLILALFPHDSSAEDLIAIGGSCRLTGATLSGGGDVALQGTTPVPAVGSAGVTIGQPGPIGISTSPTSGITLHAGFWPIVTGGAGVLDSDGDGISDALDNCLDIANGPLAGPPGCYTVGQIDTDGDGYGNPCDGDFSQDEAVNGLDVPLFATDLGTGTETPGSGTDMNCDEVVNGLDVPFFAAQLGAGVPGVLDSDGDGISDALDNCLDIANGPLAGPAGCYTVGQIDTDGDGYGNPCDGDFSQDEVVNGLDVPLFATDLGTGTETPGSGTDMNCDEVVNGLDVPFFAAQLGAGVRGP